MPDLKTILLVEDNRDDEDLALLALSRGSQSPSVDVVRDGAEALDFLFSEGLHAQRSGGLPSVVLLDLKLPMIDGLEVLRRVRAHELTRHVPVVVMTSSLQHQDIAESYARGANSYVRKPVDFHQFVELMGHLVIYWLTLNETPR